MQNGSNYFKAQKLLFLIFFRQQVYEILKTNSTIMLMKHHKGLSFSKSFKKFIFSISFTTTFTIASRIQLLRIKNQILNEQWPTLSNDQMPNIDFENCFFCDGVCVCKCVCVCICVRVCNFCGMSV